MDSRLFPIIPEAHRFLIFGNRLRMSQNYPAHSEILECNEYLAHNST